MQSLRLLSLLVVGAVVAPGCSNGNDSTSDSLLPDDDTTGMEDTGGDEADDTEDTVDTGPDTDEPTTSGETAADESTTDTPESESSGGEVTGCGEGPLTVNDADGECPGLSPQCPALPGAGAARLVGVATCSFAGADGDCEPIPVPSCPGDRAIFEFSLLNPNRGVPPGCAGTLGVDAVTNEDGSVDVEWEGEELDPETCAQVGDLMEGRFGLDGPCCRDSVDVYYPAGDFTFRLAIQTDWSE